MSLPNRIRNERIEAISRSKTVETWFVRVIFGIGMVGWLAGAFLATCKAVDLLTAYVSR